MGNSNDAECTTELSMHNPKVGLRNVALSALVFIIVLASCACKVSGVTVSVSVLHLEGMSDGHINDQVVLLNTDSSATSFDIEIVDWDRTPDGVTQTLAPGTLLRSCASWITLSQQTAILPSGSELAILIDIDVPQEAQGTNWAGLLVSARSGEESSGSDGIGLLRQFLIRIFVTTPPVMRHGIVSGLEVKGINPLGVEVAFANVGDTLLPGVSGLVEVETTEGTILFEMPLELSDVLPGHSVNWNVRGDWGLQIAGLYLVRAVVDFGAEYLVAGQSVLQVPELALTPVGMSRTSPLDLNGDGLAEDVDGDGALTLHDVDLLRESMLTDAIQRNARAFDFNNDGAATASDADILYQIVLRSLD